MHSHFSEHLANQRKDELLRDATATRLLVREELLSSIANNRSFPLIPAFWSALSLPASCQNAHCSWIKPTTTRHYA